MMRTKHAFIGLVLVGVLFFGLLAYLLVTGTTQTNREAREDATFMLTAPEEREYSVVDDENTARDGVRESLLSELGQHDNEDVAPKAEETEVLEEESEVEEAGDVSEGAVPLGDGRIATSPKAGHIFSCQQNFTGVGAHASGDWIEGEYWFPERKIAVGGSIPWTNDISITDAEGARVITSNGLPNHPTGIYPVGVSDPAYQYDRNPNAIAAQDVLLQLPKNPTVAAAPSCLSLGMIGIGLNGVAIYNGLDVQGRDAAAHEIQDSCGGHPEHSGEYHYHHESECLVDSVYEGAANTLVGYALDGFGIYSSSEAGREITNDDLDICHGHSHAIPWNGVMTNIYHYHMTKEYPYTLGCYRGTPIEVASGSDIPNTESGTPEVAPPLQGMPFPPPLPPIQ